MTVREEQTPYKISGVDGAPVHGEAENQSVDVSDASRSGDPSDHATEGRNDSRDDDRNFLPSAITASASHLPVDRRDSGITDSQRLDWLEERERVEVADADGMGFQWSRRHHGFRSQTLRERIDGCMALFASFKGGTTIRRRRSPKGGK